MVVIGGIVGKGLISLYAKTTAVANIDDTQGVITSAAAAITSSRRRRIGCTATSTFTISHSLSCCSSSSRRRRRTVVCALANGGGEVGAGSNSSNNNNKKVPVPPPPPSSNYVVPLDESYNSYSSSSCITRPLAEILRDLNKRIPDNIIIKNNNNINSSSSSESDQQQQHRQPSRTSYIPWYHANRMLSFYAPGWCGEIRDVIFSDNGSVSVVYRVTIRGSDGEAYRESTGTIPLPTNDHYVDSVAAAEEIAFCRACARFGLGLYLYHDE